MKRTAAILTLVAVVSMLGASDVRAGGALVPAAKTVGSSLTATIVTDVTQGGVDKGLTTIRVQKAGTSSAVIFASDYVKAIGFQAGSCVSNNFPDLQSSTAFRFTGFIDGFIQDPVALQSLLGAFGDPHKAAISNADYIACTSSDGGTQWVLSFTAVIGFTK